MPAQITLAELVATTGVDLTGLKSGLNQADALLSRLGAVSQKLTQQLNQAELAATGAGQGISQAGQKARAASTGVSSLERSVKQLAIAWVSMRGAQAVFNLGRLGAEAIDTSVGFRSMQEAAGQGVFALDNLRTAARGTVSDLDLMQSANTALVGSTGAFAEEMSAALPRILEWSRVASVLNPSLGDTAFLFDSMTKGIKRSSPRIIDNTGLQVQAGIANERYAESLGKTVEKLTENERATALLRDTLRAIDVAMLATGDSTNAATASYQSLGAAFKNWRVEVGKGIDEALNPAVVWLAKQTQAQTDLAEQNRELRSSFQDVIDTLEELPISKTTEETERMRQELVQTFNVWQSGGMTIEEARKQLLDIINALDGVTSHAQDLRDAELERWARGVSRGLNDMDGSLINMTGSVKRAGPFTIIYAESLEHTSVALRDLARDALFAKPMIDDLGGAMSIASIHAAIMSKDVQELGNSLRESFGEQIINFAGLVDADMMRKASEDLDTWISDNLDALSRLDDFDYAAAIADQRKAINDRLQAEADLNQQLEELGLTRRISLADRLQAEETFRQEMKRIANDLNLTAVGRIRAENEARKALDDFLSVDAATLVGPLNSTTTEIKALSVAARGAVAPIEDMGGAMSMGSIRADAFRQSVAELSAEIESSSDQMLLGFVGRVSIESITAGKAALDEWRETNVEMLNGLSDFDQDLAIKTAEDVISDKLQLEEQYSRNVIRLGEERARASERQASKIRSDLESLLQPTMTFDIDNWLDQQGLHEDTWDEWFRRALDVVNLGEGSPWFTELVAAFPSFRAILAETEDPRAAAAQWSKNFQLGLVPEAINRDVIKQRYKDMITGKQNLKGILDEIAAELRAEGFIVDLPTLQAAAGAPPPITAESIDIGAVLDSPELLKGTMELGALSGAAFSTGMLQETDSAEIGSGITGIIDSQLKDQATVLSDIGRNAGAIVISSAVAALAAVDDDPIGLDDLIVPLTIGIEPSVEVDSIGAALAAVDDDPIGLDDLIVPLTIGIEPSVEVDSIGAALDSQELLDGAMELGGAMSLSLQQGANMVLAQSSIDVQGLKLASPELLAGAIESGGEIGVAVSRGANRAFTQSGIGADFKNELEKQIGGQAGNLKIIGKGAGELVAEAFLDGLTEPDFLGELTDAIFPGIRDRLNREDER